MKTIIGCFLGLFALVTSFSGGSPVYADTLEAEASALSVLAPDAGTNSVGTLDDAHCVLYSNGADNCIVNAQPEVVDQWSTTVNEIDPSATAQPAAIRFVDAIPVAVIQTVTIAAPSGDREETTSAQPMPVPATEPISDRDAKTTTGALVPPVDQSADAIVVAIVQSVTVAVPGQSASDGEEPRSAELLSAPAALTSVLAAKTTDRDNAE